MIKMRIQFYCDTSCEQFACCRLSKRGRLYLSVILYKAIVFIAIIHDLCETAKPFYKMPIKIKPGKEKSF